jgi:glycosyltransferase involved in cell wall biosynthesis
VVLGVVPSLSGGLVARLAAARFRVPYGLVFQDLIGPAAVQSGMGDARAARAVRAAEGWAARGAAAVGVIAEGFRGYLESLGVRPQRIVRVRNWTHVQQASAGPAETRERLGLPWEATICLHAGNMGYKQGLANLVECARLAAGRHPELSFVLMGDGNQREPLERLAARYHLANLRFLPVQPAEVFPDVLAAADVLLVNQRATVTDMSLPGKLTSYFVSGRPVVAAVSPDSETAVELRASGAGVLVPPDDPVRLLRALLALADDPSERKRLGANGLAYAEANLGPGPALAGLEALVGQVAAARVAAGRVAGRQPDRA